MWLIRAALRRPITVLVAMTFVALTAVFAVTRMRADIFPDLDGSIKKAWTLTIGEQPAKVLDLRSILDHKIHTISKASPAKPVDSKHDCDARTLGAIFGHEVPLAPAG